MGPDEVGAFSADRSPFGVLDLGGNVAEWTGLQRLTRVARGGYWSNDLLDARAAARYVHYDVRYGLVGVRVCVAAPSAR